MEQRELELRPPLLLLLLLRVPAVELVVVVVLEGGEVAQRLLVVPRGQPSHRLLPSQLLVDWRQLVPGGVTMAGRRGLTSCGGCRVSRRAIAILQPAGWNTTSRSLLRTMLS